MILEEFYSIEYRFVLFFVTRSTLIFLYDNRLFAELQMTLSFLDLISLVIIIFFMTYFIRYIMTEKYCFCILLSFFREKTIDS